MNRILPLCIGLGIAAAVIASSKAVEGLFLRWYEVEIGKLNIPERADEAIVTYPLA